MAAISTADFKKGMYIIFRDEPHQISGMEFVNPGKGSAFYRVKLKNTRNGRVIEFTFKSGETAEEYVVDTRELQYLYKDDSSAYFMNPQTFDQTAVLNDLVGDFLPFLQEGNTYQVLLHEDEAVGIRPPKRVVFKVTATERTTGGNTVGRVLKPATLENGVEVQVPAFIKEGDKIAINSEDGAYLERVND